MLQSTRELLALCSGEASSPSGCLQYIKGVRSGVHAQKLFSVLYLSQKHIDPPVEIKAIFLRPLICVPEADSDESVRDRVVSGLTSMPAKMLDAEAGFIVMMSLATTYPCEKK